jgi:hypothetical protein
VSPRVGAASEARGPSPAELLRLAPSPSAMPALNSKLFGIMAALSEATSRAVADVEAAFDRGAIDDEPGRRLDDAGSGRLGGLASWRRPEAASGLEQFS